MKTMKSSGDLGFNGQTNAQPVNGGYNKKYQHSLAQTPSNPDRINSGRGPLKGNTGTPGPLSRTAGSGQPQPGREMFSGSPQQRQAVSNGETRAFQPSATMNYQGNPNKINVGRGPTRGTEAR